LVDVLAVLFMPLKDDAFGHGLTDLGH
jgi:hypothetical protein